MTTSPSRTPHHDPKDVIALLNDPDSVGRMLPLCIATECIEQLVVELAAAIAEARYYQTTCSKLEAQQLSQATLQQQGATVPKEWEELGGIPGPENEPAALVAWLTTAQKEGADELVRRMQGRLLLWEKTHLDDETMEFVKTLPIFKPALASPLAPEAAPPQDWKDIFEKYRTDGLTDAWLYQQIVAHAQRAAAPHDARDASVPFHKDANALRKAIEKEPESPYRQELRSYLSILDAERNASPAAALAAPLSHTAPSHAQWKVDAQAKDGGLWFDAQLAPEAYLQRALRELHAAVEADSERVSAIEPINRKLRPNYPTPYTQEASLTDALPVALSREEEQHK